MNPMRAAGISLVALGVALSSRAAPSAVTSASPPDMPDTDERREALLGRLVARRVGVDERTAAQRRVIRSRWGEVLGRRPVTDELRNHAMRVADLARIHDIADVYGRADLAARVAAVVTKEGARHEERMAVLVSEAAPSGGAP